MSESQANQNLNTDQVQFASSQIGTKTAKKQDPFAEQNAKRAKKQEQQSDRMKKILITIISILVVILVALIVWLIVLFANRTNDSTTDEAVQFTQETVNEDMAKLRELASNAYDRKLEENTDGSVTMTDGDLDAAEEVFSQTLTVPGNEDFSSEINLAKIIFLVDNGQYYLAISVKDSVDIDKLTNENKFIYYNMLNLAYAGIGDTDMSNEYIRLQTDAMIELNGGGQG